MSREFPWYEAVEKNEPLQQGDFLLSCPIFVPATTQMEEGETLPIEIVEYDVIIMTQSCDLALKKIDFVLVCPIWPLTEIEKRNDFFRKQEGKESLRQGNVPGYHLLNKCDMVGLTKEFTVVDFRSTYSTPYTVINDISRKQGRRLRLLPPYREHLSQAYARFFMRVGLPIDIPKFK